MTYFITGHFHYVLSMGAIYAILAAFYYYGGKMFGVQYNETWAQLQFVLFTLGVNILFFPFHFLGYAGLPRRIPDYPAGFVYWNQISTLGTIMVFISLIIFFNLVYKSLSDKYSNIGRYLI